MSPFEIKSVDQHSSEALLALVSLRQDERMKALPVITKTRADAGAIKIEVISERLRKASDKLQKEYDRHCRSEEKLQRVLTEVVALRSQLGLDPIDAE